MTYRAAIRQTLTGIAWILLAGTTRAGLAGEVQVQQWKNLPGFQVTDALAEGALTRSPDGAWTGKGFEAISKEAGAVRMYAWVVAPADGEYRFLLAGADTAVLFGGVGDKADGRQQIALVPAAGSRCEWRRYAAQVSKPIALKAGSRYLVEAIAKNGDGSGHVEVGWILPDGKTEGPIPAERIQTITGKLDLPAYAGVKSTVTLKPRPGPATRPGQHLFPRDATVELAGERFDMSYSLELPSDYDRTGDKRPLLIFLHGNSHQGWDLEGILNEGPAQYLNERPDLRRWFPMVLVCPQLPPGWRWDKPGAAGVVVGLIEQICQRYPRIDRDRVYLSGLSMGGKGTWMTALEAPQTFAAIVPISAVAVQPKTAGKRLAGVGHIWIICGERDRPFASGSQEMAAALSPALGERVKLTVVPNGDHQCWVQFYPNRSFYEELMKHRRGKNGGPQAGGKGQ